MHFSSIDNLPKSTPFSLENFGPVEAINAKIVQPEIRIRQHYG